MKDLLWKYGISMIFSAVRKLDQENTELKEKLRLTENQLKYRESQLRDIYITERDEDYDQYDLSMSDKEFLKTTEALPAPVESQMYGMAAKPFNIRRGSAELIKQARAKYESSSQKQVEEQEAVLSELTEAGVTFDETPAEILLSERKKEYYLQTASAIRAS